MQWRERPRVPSVCAALGLSVYLFAGVSVAHETDGEHDAHGFAARHPEIVQQMLDKAIAVRAAVTPYLPRTQQTLDYDLDDPERRVMDFFPGALGPNRGVDVGLMMLEGRIATHALLRTALSQEGYLQVQSIMSMEDYLREQDPYSSVRDSGNYAISLFGDPGADVPWGWKFEGHHLSLNVTVSQDQVRTTPVFLGANPAEVRGGVKTGLRLLAPHQDLAFELLASLDEAQRARAISPGDVPAAVIQRGGATTAVGDHGLSAAAMTDDQRGALLSVIAAYAAVMRGELAREELDRVQAAGLENLRFEWRGSQDPVGRHYYRIDGPTVVIEFDAVVDDPAVGANHVHAVWHDPRRDFGEDLLQAHYRQEEHPKGAGG